MPSLSLWNAKAVPLRIYTNTVDRVRLILEFQVEHLCTFEPSLFDIIDDQILETKFIIYLDKEMLMFGKSYLEKHPLDLHVICTTTLIIK